MSILDKFIHKATNLAKSLIEKTSISTAEAPNVWIPVEYNGNNFRIKANTLNPSIGESLSANGVFSDIEIIIEGTPRTARLNNLDTGDISYQINGTPYTVANNSVVDIPDASKNYTLILTTANTFDLIESDFVLNNDAYDYIPVAFISSVGVGDKVKVSADDSDSGYLEAKLTVLNNEGLNTSEFLEYETINPAANEVRQLNFDTQKLAIELGVGYFETTVGDSAIAGEDGVYLTYKAAIDAGFSRIEIVGGTLDTASIILDANKDYSFVSVNRGYTNTFTDMVFSSAGIVNSITFTNVNIILSASSSRNYFAGSMFDYIYINDCIITNISTAINIVFANLNSGNKIGYVSNTKIYLNNELGGQVFSGAVNHAETSFFNFENVMVVGGGNLSNVFSYGPNNGPRINFKNFFISGITRRISPSWWRGEGLYYEGTTEMWDVGENNYFNGGIITNNVSSLGFNFASSSAALTAKNISGDMGIIRFSAGMTGMKVHFENCIFKNFHTGNGALTGHKYLNCTITANTELQASWKDFDFSGTEFQGTVLWEASECAANRCKFKADVNVVGDRNNIITSKTDAGIDIVLNGDFNDVSHCKIGTTNAGSAFIDDNGIKNTTIGNATEAAIDIAGATTPNQANNIQF